MCIHREGRSYGGSYHRVITLIAAIKWRQQHPRGVGNSSPKAVLVTHTPSPSLVVGGGGHVCREYNSTQPNHIVNKSPPRLIRRR